jgi:sulfate transport system permease protein
MTARYALRFGALGYLTMLLLVPVGLVFYRTFQHGLHPAWASVTNPQALHALWLTLIIAAIAVPLNTAFGVVLGIALVRHRFPGRGLLNAIVDLPLALSPVVVGLALYLLYGTGGWLAGLSEHGIKILFSLPGMTLATIFVSLPFVVREVVPVLREIGTDQEQAAETLGAAPFTTFRRITLPAIRWAVSYGVVLTTARAIGEFGAVSIVSGRIEGKTETLPLYVQSQFDSSLGINPTGAFAASVVLALIALMTVLAMRLFRPNAASLAMPLKGRRGFAGTAVSTRLAGRMGSESEVNDSKEGL